MQEEQNFQNQFYYMIFPIREDEEQRETKWDKKCKKFEKFLVDFQRYPTKNLSDNRETNLYKWWIRMIDLSTRNKLASVKENKLREIVEKFKVNKERNEVESMTTKIISFIRINDRFPRYFCNDVEERNLARWYYPRMKAGELKIIKLQRNDNIEQDIEDEEDNNEFLERIRNILRLNLNTENEEDLDQIDDIY